MGWSFLNDGEVVDLLVSIDVVDDASKVLLAWVGMNSPAQLRENSLRNGQVSAADLFSLNANVLISSVLVVADGSEAFRKDNDGISLDDESLWGLFGHIVEVLSIVLVGHSWGSVVDDLNIIKNLWVLDIDEGNGGKASSQADTSNVDLSQVGLLSDQLKIVKDVGGDGIPHALVGLLDLAVAADVGVNDLVGIENVLPDIEQGVGVPEGEDNEGRVYTEDTFHILCFFLDVVAVEWLVFRGADIAVPVDEVLFIVSTNDHRVSEEHLLDIGQCCREREEEEAGDNNFHV